MNVFDAAMRRIGIMFENFDYVYVSFSGGKDSGLLLNMCIDYARKHGKRLGVFHMDYECQYEMTTAYVEKMLSDNSDILDIYHVCVPFKVPTCTSMFQSFWRPWESSMKELWVRQMPATAMTESDFSFYNNEMWDYDFQKKFSSFLKSKLGVNSICCMVGIRTQESLNRWRAIYSDKNTRKYDGYEWTLCFDGVVNAYPLYDFNVDDVWIANAKNAYPYNRLYDLYYMAGVPVNAMRVASPFISEGQESLKLYRVIEPNTWGMMVSRVNGVNFTGIYGGTTAMGWKSITLPKGHSWKSYMYFLLSTLPEETRSNYLNKLNTSIRFWREKGGVLSEETISKLKELGIDIKVEGHSNYRTYKKPVRMEYLDDVDLPEFREIPTFKRMCICIMKNDHFCKYMGFSQTRKEIERRNEIIEKYNSLL